ncbi:hypothetical protein [Halopiger xanaduensis]|uniref:CARDB domain-containing protein n=1 Tax=Halopiger xanaduensis (strain DSM 18323 / JCM 14033 / SH-6) TaxID=797210 RepID=F8D8X0_HALXS|nr:hypothetical protein [Halopiger xanaduensis]AEH38042.1 hypothetical protein Halxa_3431 [Halopiger xanaduensis SH-6]
MRGPTRRRVLRGISTGGVVLGATRWSQGIDRGEARVSTGAQDASGSGEGTPNLEVEIIETDAPVHAGEYLGVTVAITNHGTSAIRPDVDFLVGEDPDRFSRVSMMIEPGETRTTSHGFYTYPVPRDEEFPVRVETDGDADERTVSVIGASRLSNASPGGEFAVEPGTEILFEAAPNDPDESHNVVWWVDGEQANSFVGPWEWAYFGEIGTYFFRHPFESPGTHDVAAAVIPREREETYTAHWRVDVTASGIGSPTVEAIRPEPGTVPMTGNEPVTFELEATDPATSLERVVWWLTQADVILDVTELSGRTDTAQLVTDSACHTCHVVPWVICSDGTVTQPDAEWQLERVEDDGSDGEPGSELELSIRTTNSPVDAGEYLEVIVDITNTGSETGRQTLELIVGHDPKKLDTQDVVVEPGETGAATLGFETYPTKRDEQFPVRVRGEDDTVVTSVQVFAK